MTDRGPGYRDRVAGRIRKARRRGAQALGLVVVLSLALTLFLLHGLATAVRVGDGSAVRAAWVGMAVMLMVVVVSWMLYRSQRRVLDQAAGELDDIVGDAPAGDP